MTHEYVICLNGRVEPSLAEDDATAVGWAGGSILAVGPDQVVRAISRGDSVFLDVGGCLITPFPTDLDSAVAVIREQSPPAEDIARRLVEAGLLPAGALLEPGSPADLAFWDEGRLLATVRDGHFTEGEAHCGPFPSPSPT